eukprot:PITA_27319
MQEAKIGRNESNQGYISIVDQNKKELETSSIEVSRLRIENEKQKEQIQVLNREVEKTTLLSVQVEEAKKMRKILKRWFQEELAQKQEELDATRDEINKLKGSKKEYLQDKTDEEEKMRQLKMVKLQLMKGTTQSGLWYPKVNNLIIQAFTGSDWEGSVDDHKSTSGAAFYLGGCLVSWLSKKQTSISLSTTEVEYITVASCCTQGLWMKKTFQDLQVKFDEPIPIFCDNTRTISMSKNLVMHSKMKHILIKYHFFREQVAENNNKLEYVGTEEKIVDIFTKPLPREAFEYLHQKLGILPSSH